MSSKNKKILILTTKQNNVWLSMQEIIPALERSWKQAAENMGFDVVELDADKARLNADEIQEILGVDLIYVCAFNVSIAQKLVLLRQKMFIDAPWVFQLHNQATIGMWPLFHWGMGDLLKTSDRFISTSRRDASCFDALFENKQADIIPFSNIYEPERNKSQRERVFCYVGRVSEQKNIHTLIWAFSRYRKAGGKYNLDIIGGEDELSSPNMGMKSQGYLNFLKRLCKKLNISKSVRFLGHIKRDDLHMYWREHDCVLVNASLHSDENFGMALLHGLCYGHSAIMSDWGGHTDFASSFPKQVSLLRVYSSFTGPYLSVEEFTHALHHQEENKMDMRPHTPNSYLFGTVVKETEKILRSTLAHKDQEAESLKHSDLLKQTLERVKLYESYKHGKIFESYQDALSHLYFRYYGMENVADGTKKGMMAPWCNREGEKIEVKDPHRGERSLSETDAIKAGYIQ